MTKKIDILFLIAGLPVSTLAMPEVGSESYAGLATQIESATGELIDMFPSFRKTTPKNVCNITFYAAVNAPVTTYFMLFMLLFIRNPRTHLSGFTYTKSARCH